MTDMKNGKAAQNGPPTPTPAPTSNSPAKPKRERSPNYPAIDLESAIERAKLFFAQERRQSAPVNIAMRHMGFQTMHGQARVILSALLKYGLLEEEGRGETRQVKLSRLGQNILLDSQAISPERDAAIKEAALRPKILADLWRRYQNELPSDDTFRTYLMRDLLFTGTAADDLISIYKDTIKFAKLGIGDTIGECEEDECESETPENERTMNRESMPSQGQSAPPRRPDSSPPPPQGYRDIPILLPSMEIVTIRGPAHMSTEDFDSMIETLNKVKNKWTVIPSQQ